MQNITDELAVIESPKRFSQSLIWQMQRDYFDREGIQAWVNQVPFYITNNTFIADNYADVMFGLIRDWLHKYPDAKKHPFYLLELGAGSGQFAYLFVQALRARLEKFQLADCQICYVMSDVTARNMQYWENHPALKKFIEQGMIDFAIYDTEKTDRIWLTQSEKFLNAEQLKNPLMVFANYVFDTISHDAFALQQGQLKEVLLTLSAPLAEHPVQMDKIVMHHQLQNITSDYYDDVCLNEILQDYQQTLDQTYFSLPVGAIKLVRYLKKIANNQLFIIATDKGYSTLASLNQLTAPTFSLQGSFSLMVNFHAILAYFKKTGGDGFAQTSRKGIKTIVLSSQTPLADLPYLSVAMHQVIEGFSSNDYCLLYRRFRDSYATATLETIGAQLELSKWDPYTYLLASHRIVALLDQASEDVIHLFASNMPKLAKNYYYMPQTECVLFEIGVFFHALKKYAEALKYYMQAEPFIRGQFGVYFNMGLCQYYLNQKEAAYALFHQALSIDPASQKTINWLAHLEKSLGSVMKI